MNASWTRGALWDRVALHLRRAESRREDPIEMFGELRAARKILILPNDRVGGLFIGASLYKIVRHFYPDAHIVLLVDEKKASIAHQIPFFDRIITGTPNRSIWSAPYKKIVEDLRRETFDLIFCPGLDCSFRLAQLCGDSGARLRVGFRREGQNPFNIEIVPQTTEIYEGELYLVMLRLLGLEGSGDVKWTLTQEKARQIRERYLEQEFASRHLVGIDLAPGESRGLSNRQLDDIVGRVIERGARAVLFFSLAEKKKVEYFKETYGNRVLLFEQDDLARVAALIEGCTALISCNTDLLHLALALRIPAVGIFDEDPGRWIAALSHQVKVIQVKDIRTLNITLVREALEQLLQEQQRAQMVEGEKE